MKKAILSLLLFGALFCAIGVFSSQGRPAGGYPQVGQINICDYGAGPQKSAAANTTAIHNAIADMAAGMTLYVPPGTFNCNALTINKSIKVRGDSYSSVLKASAAVTGDFITCEITSPSYIDFLTMRDIKIDVSAAGASARALVLIRAVEPELVRVYVQGSNNNTTGAQTGVVMDGTAAWAGGLRMDRCRLHGMKYGVRLLNTTTSCHIVSNWILGCSTPQVDSIGIYCDGTSGHAWMVAFNEIESWATGVHDLGTNMLAFGNRFESVTSTFYLGGYCHQLFGNTHPELITRDPSRGDGLEWNLAEGFSSRSGTGGAATSPMITLTNSAEGNGPSVNLTNSYESSAVAIAMKAFGRNATDLFNATPAIATTNIASQFKCKIGTTSTVDLELLRNKAKGLALVSGGVEISDGNLYFGSSGYSAPGVVVGVVDPTAGSGVNRGLGTIYVSKHVDLLYDDFETGVRSANWTSVTGSPVVGTWATVGVAAPTAGGSYGLHIPSESRLRKTVSETTIWLDMLVMSGAAAATTHFICNLPDGTNWSSLSFTATGDLNPPKVRFANGPTGNYDGTTTIATSTWYRVIVKYVKSATVGEVKVWIDGNLEIDQSGINTADAAVNNVYLGKTEASQSMYYDYFRVLESDPATASGILYVKTGMRPTEWTKLNP